MKVLLAMSGGVDSSVAGARLLEAGHTVVGVTMRLWGGESDTGCCSVADVDDARRVAQQLDIDHVVFNFGDDFDEHVVSPYVSAHVTGRTPNPCIECNRHVKFARLAERADVLGFDAVATGHHARIGRTANGRYTLERGVDRAKDQSYVVHMLGQRDLASTLFPIGEITKDEVRRIAAGLGLRTAAKPDSQDVCFVTSTGGREQFLGGRIPFRRADVVDTRWPPGRHDRRARVGDDRSASPARPAGRRAEAVRRRRRSRRRDRDDRVGDDLVDTGLHVTDVSWVDDAACR